MKLKMNSCYIRNDGHITGRLKKHPSNHKYPFYDPDNRVSYSANAEHENREPSADLIAPFLSPAEASLKIQALEKKIEQLSRFFKLC